MHRTRGLVPTGPLPRRFPAAVLLCFAVGSCGGVPPDAPGSARCPGVSASQATLRLPVRELELGRISDENLRAWVELLAAPELRGRHAASAEAAAVAALLAEELAVLGLSPPFPGGSFCHSFPILGTRDQNVIAHLSGAPPGEARPVVLIGAHYDGQGVHPAGSAFPGADDNATGVAALLEVARLARQRHPQWRVDLVFAAFGAEETGQMGSGAYAAEPSVPLSRVVLMINLDMVGRPLPGARADAIGFLAQGSESERVREFLEQAGTTAGVAIRNLADLDEEGFGEPGSMRTDASVFSPRVPTLFLTTGTHADHHELTDTPDRIDYEQVARAAKLVLALLESVAP
ncbi:MAG: M20/M25/M40 family metallo-hydrolase [bacterium]|nr:M20/M25/M40 family metallo-hydrolase [bacterium]